MLKKIKNIASKTQKWYIAACISIVGLLASKTAFATTDEPISSVSSGQISNRLFGNGKNIAMAFGGGLVCFGFIMIAIRMIFDHNKAGARAEGMDSMLTVALGAIILGGISLVVGLIWGNAGGLG